MSIWTALVDHLIDVWNLFLSFPTNINEKFHYAYFITFIALGYFSYRRYGPGDRELGSNQRKKSPKHQHQVKGHPKLAKGHPKAAKGHPKAAKGHPKAAKGGAKTGFFGFLFPKSIYWHRSAKLDYVIFIVNILISPLLLFTAGLQAYLSIEVGEFLVGLNGGNALSTGNWSAPTFALFILGYTLAADLSVYLIHRLHHSSNILWPLHALHHSAEVMTPVTLFRKHPLWIVLAGTLNVTLTGLFQGVFIFFCYGVPSVELLFGINTLYVFYNFFGANLRHSHIWLSWGKPLSYLFISPAMHQIHHDPNRMHKNYGEIFAIWDWLFGSLYIPVEKETFKIGLHEKNPHRTLARAYWVPVADMLKNLSHAVRRRSVD